ncbi:MAG: DUF1848 domain-containing protein [Bacteroidales bacterium]|nr:DUF1848 domain-containing protein [Bacteroidales bacterium]
MIINAGGRTDLVNYFSEWLFHRFEDKKVYSRNPFYPQQVYLYNLSPEQVDCVVFCSKNYSPILKDFYKIYQTFNVFCHYTITAYSKDIEPNVPDIDYSINTLINLSKQIGKEKLVWRYDPVIFTSYYNIEEHCKTFDYISKQVSPYVNYSLFSFVEIYPRVQNQIPNIIPPTFEMKEFFCKRIGEIAKKNNLRIQTCADNDNYIKYGIEPSGCVTAKILSKALKVNFKNIKHSGIRENCRCLPMRDIGAYNTCLNGCKYCYANTKPQEIQTNIQKHNPLSPLLIGEIQPTDIIKQTTQTSFLNKENIYQGELF